MKLQVTVLFGLLLLAGVSDAQTISGNRIKEVSATECRRYNAGSNEKCKFNSRDLKLKEGGSIEITVKEGGRRIKCSHSSNSSELAWYVMFSS